MVFWNMQLIYWFFPFTIVFQLTDQRYYWLTRRKIVYKAIYRKWYRATLNKWWHCQQNNRMHRVDKICSLQNFWSSGNYSIVNRKRFENVTLLVSKKREKETMWCCGIISIPLSIHLFFAYHTCIKHSGCNFRFYTH